MLFAFKIWGLWKQRNKRVFIQATPNGRLSKEVYSMALNYHYCAGRAKPMRTKSPINVGWNKPEKNWYKLNTDGLAIGNPSKAGGGGIIQDHNGVWISGFSRAIGIATSVEAELWALRDGLKICNPLNLLAVEIELDAKVVMD